nr:MAG TPA: hypothetical protein [Caudoviricetes sp.]
MDNYEKELNSIIGNDAVEINNNTNQVSTDITTFNINNRTINIPPAVTDIVVKGDTNSRIITFELNRYFDGVDLSTKTIRINYENSEGLTGNNEVANIVATESSLTFDWTIESGLTTNSGNVKIAIDCYEVNSNDNVIYRWQTIPLSFDVLDTIEVVNNAIALSYEKEKNFVTNNNNLTILTDIHDTDIPIEVVNRTINTPLYEDIVVSMDNNSQIISFTIDRYFDGVDLLNKVIAIKYINALNESDRTFAVNVSNTDNKITFGWLIDNKVTKKNGYVRFAIEFLGYLDNGEFYCWSTKPSQIEVSEGLYVDDSIEQPTPSWLQSWQIQADNNLKSMELQLRVNGNYVQWKHYNDSQWVNLFNIGDISGTTTKDNLTNIETQTVIDTSSNSEYLQLIITDKDGNITTHDIKPVDGINGLTGIVYDIVDIDSTKSSLQTQINKYMADTTFAKTTKNGQLWLLTQQSGNYTYELDMFLLGEEPTKTLSLNKNTFIPITFTFQTVPIVKSTYTVGTPIELSSNSVSPVCFVFSHLLPEDADTTKKYLIPDNNIVPDFSKYFDGNFKEVNSVSGEEVTYKNAIVVNNIVENINADYVMGIFDSDSPTGYYSKSAGVLTRSYGLFIYKNGDTDWKRYEIDNKTTFKDNNWVKYFGGDYFETRIKYSKIKINEWLNYGEYDKYRPTNNKFDSHGLSLDTTQPVVSYKTYIYQDNKWTNIGNSSISELLNASLTEYTKTADLPVKDVQVNNKTVVDGSTKVAKIDVPTKVSQLTNDSKFISQNIQIGGSEPTDENILLWYDENDSGFVVQYSDGENIEF